MTRKPIRVEVPFEADDVADGRALVLTCDVTLGRAAHGETYHHGDSVHEVEILAVVEDPSGVERADLVDALPLGTVEDLAVEAARRLEVEAEIDAGEREADYRREERLLGAAY